MPKLGLDEQKPDTRPATPGNAAMDAKAQNSGSWVRSKLRCVRLKQRKRAKSIAEFLSGLGVPWDRCWTTAACGKGWWRMAHTPAAQQGMSNAWFQAQGLVNPLERYLQLQH